MFARSIHICPMISLARNPASVRYFASETPLIDTAHSATRPRTPNAISRIDTSASSRRTPRCLVLFGFMSVSAGPGVAGGGDARIARARLSAGTDDDAKAAHLAAGGEAVAAG